MASRFKYVAVSRSGRREAGVVEAEDEAKAKAIIDSRSLLPVSVRQLSTGRGDLNLLFRRAVRYDDLIFLTRKLLTLNRAGLPLLRSLEIAAGDTSDSRLESVLQDVRKSLEGGSSFSQALERHTGYFPQLFVSTVRSGEESGALDTMLRKALELLEREERIRQRVREAVRYPVMVGIAMMLAFLIIITVVIPKFAGMYSSYGAELPWATRLLIGINSFMARYWPVLVTGLPALIVAGWRIRRISWGKKGLDYMALSIPVIGAVFAKAVLSRFCYVLSTLLSTGMPLSQSLDILKATLNNSHFSKVVDKMGENLSGGRDLIQPMRESKYFSPMVVQMFHVGLESGSLGGLLAESARHYDAEIEYETRKLTSRIEPILTVVIAAGVLVLALAIFLPMWNLIGIFKR
jgi:MSHA biogenesis protein MshG